MLNEGWLLFMLGTEIHMLIHVKVHTIKYVIDSVKNCAFQPQHNLRAKYMYMSFFHNIRTVYIEC